MFEDTYDPSGIQAFAAALKVSGSLGTLNLLGNGMWEDEAKAFIEVYEQSTTLQSLCGLTSGVTKLDLSNQFLNPPDALLLAAELKKGVTTGWLNSFDLSGETYA